MPTLFYRRRRHCLPTRTYGDPFSWRNLGWFCAVAAIVLSAAWLKGAAEGKACQVQTMAKPRLTT